jgi:light-regulated signal transduction histidine kinase (bacteriophytochrome)
VPNIEMVTVVAPFGGGLSRIEAAGAEWDVINIGVVVFLLLVLYFLFNWLVRKHTKKMLYRMEELEAEINAHEGIEQELIDLTSTLEEQLGGALSQLEATNKELEAIAYSVSHDLRSPLRSMLAYSEILLNEYSEGVDDEGRLYQQRIRTNAERLDGYIAGMLDYYGLSHQELSREQVDLTELVHQVIGELSDQIGEREIEFSVAELPSIIADRALIRVVVTHLISNAIKFTDQQLEPKISIGSSEENDRIIYFVEDNGIGLDMKFAETIFETFQRLHGVDQYVGRGIGLALVRRIIHRHGGNVWVKSAVGEGATFFFTIGDEQSNSNNHSH